MDIFPAAKQRAALIEFARSLGSRDSAIRRDSCGDPMIVGSSGHIYATPGGSFASPDASKPSFQIMFAGDSARGWGFAKTAMSFCRLVVDCDEEGSLFLDRLPTKREAEIIRAKLGIAKKREESEATLQRLRAMSVKHGFSRQDALAA